MKKALKGKGDQWVPPQIKNYKLIIPKNHVFMALKAFFDILGINTDTVEIGNGEYQTSLNQPPKKIALHCKEIDKFNNEIDSQPST